MTELGKERKNNKVKKKKEKKNREAEKLELWVTCVYRMEILVRVAKDEGLSLIGRNMNRTLWVTLESSQRMAKKPGESTGTLVGMARVKKQDGAHMVWCGWRGIDWVWY